MKVCAFSLLFFIFIYVISFTQNATPKTNADELDFSFLRNVTVEGRLSEAFPGIGHGMIQIVLSNGTHLIHSTLLYYGETLEIVEQDHFLIEITEDGYLILEDYKTLAEIPNYESFLPISEVNPE